MRNFFKIYSGYFLEVRHSATLVTACGEVQWCCWMVPMMVKPLSIIMFEETIKIMFCGTCLRNNMNVLRKNDNWRHTFQCIICEDIQHCYLKESKTYLLEHNKLYNSTFLCNILSDTFHLMFWAGALNARLMVVRQSGAEVAEPCICSPSTRSITLIEEKDQWYFAIDKGFFCNG